MQVDNGDEEANKRRKLLQEALELDKDDDDDDRSGSEDEEGKGKGKAKDESDERCVDEHIFPSIAC